MPNALGFQMIIYSELMTNRETPTEQFTTVSPKSDPVGKWPKNPSPLSQPATSVARKHFAINAIL